MKPFLKADNKNHQDHFCLSCVEEDGCFADMFDHIDKTWFYITCDLEQNCVVKGEIPPGRKCKSK